MFRLALAQLPLPTTPDESITLATDAIARAADAGAELLCFPECFVPGYRVGKPMPAPDAAFLERAWSTIAEATARAGLMVALGTERIVGGERRISVLVVDRQGALVGFQDKVQLDPSEDDVFSPGRERRLFTCGPLTFGIAICHEGFRYPETVRWAARRGAQLVLHPHVHEAIAGSSFHDQAALCRAAENTCFYATVNCACPGAPTTSAVVRPDGTLLAHLPNGERGLLVADLDLAEATGLLARRLVPEVGVERAAPAPRRCVLTGARLDLMDVWLNALLADRRDGRVHGRYLCIDIDDFMRFIDHHGMPESDQALRYIGEALRARYGDDAVFRTGGDELTVALGDDVPAVVPSAPDGIVLKSCVLDVDVRANRRHHHALSLLRASLARAMVDGGAGSEVVVVRYPPEC